MKQTLIGGLAAILLILLAGVLLFLVPRLFLASTSFRQVVIEETRKQSGFAGEWMPFHLEGWTLTSKGFEGTRPFPGGRLRLRVEAVRIDLNWRGLLRRQWQIENISVGGLDLDVGFEEPGSDPRATDPERIAATSPGPLAFLIPHRVEIASVDIQNGRMHFHGGPADGISLSDLKIRARPSGGAGGKSWAMGLAEGVLQLPDRPSWSLNSARVNHASGVLTVLESEWFGQEAGIVRISGPLMAGDRLQSDLRLAGTGIPLKSIVPKRWRSFVRGNLNGEATLLASFENIHLRGEATGNGITLVGVPALRAMQKATGIVQWTELPLDTAFTRFDYQNQELELTTTVLESENLVRTEGGLRVGPDQLLDGTFQVGFAPRVTTKIPGSERAVFVVEKNGYRWASPPMQISGTLNRPREDLSPRLKEAVFKAVEDTVREKVGEGVNLLDALLQQIP